VSEPGAALNGRTGRIEGRNDVSGRWVVKLHDSTDIKQIKWSNLRLLSVAEMSQDVNAGNSTIKMPVGAAFNIDDEVKVFGLVSELGSTLNGQSGRIIGYVNGRWRVKLSDSKEIKQIKECNLRLLQVADRSQPDILSDLLHPHGGPHFDSTASFGGGSAGTHQASALSSVACTASRGFGVLV
jgi:hypothetical protein